MNRLKNILQFRYILITLIILYFTSCIINTIFFNSSKYNGDEKYIYGYVKSIKISNSKIELRIIGLEEIIANYYVSTYDELNDFLRNVNLGDYIKINGSLNEPLSSTNYGMFNYKKYLNNQNIYYILNIDTYEKIKKNGNVFLLLKQKIIEHINSYTYSSSYLHSFVMGNKDYMSYDELNSYSGIGINHLFAISGMHIGFMVSILSKLFSKSKKCIRYIFVSVFILFYLFLIDYSVTALRACLFLLLGFLNKKFKLNYSSIKLVIITFFIILIFNPNYLFNMSFQISIIVSFFLVLFSKFINNSKNVVVKLFKVSYISFISTLPIIIYYFNNINFISIFVNILFVPIVTYLLFPLCIITFVFPLFDYILYILFSLFSYFASFINSISILKFSFCDVPIFVIILYYVFLLLYYRFKNTIILYIILIVVHYNIMYLNPYVYLYVFDVGQGDSTLIIFPHNRGNILIDTGGKMSYCNSDLGCNSYNLSTNLIIPSLKKFGVKGLDYLLLSHGDFDHMGEAINLVNNFKVDNVIFNNDSYNELETELIKVLDNKDVKYYKGLKELNIGSDKLYFLNTKEYTNENDNSNVVYFKLNNYKFWFYNK